jgi:hypothetical protein
VARVGRAVQEEGHHRERRAQARDHGRLRDPARFLDLDEALQLALVCEDLVYDAATKDSAERMPTALLRELFEGIAPARARRLASRVELVAAACPLEVDRASDGVILCRAPDGTVR